MNDPLLVVVLAALLMEIAVALWAAWVMNRRYGRRLVRSLLWDRLIAAEARTVVAGLVIGTEVTYRLVRFLAPLPPIPQPWGVAALTGALMLLFWGPIADLRTLQAIEQGNQYGKDIAPDLR